MADKFKDISIAKWKKLNDEEKKEWKEVIKSTFLGMNKKTMENKSEDGKAAKMDKDIRKKNLQLMSGIWKQSKITSTAVKTVSSHWGKLLGLAIFLLPKKFWVGLKETLYTLYDFFKGVTWKDLKNSLPLIILGFGALAAIFNPKKAFMIAMTAFQSVILGFKGMKWVGGKLVQAGTISPKVPIVDTKKTLVKTPTATKITALPGGESTMKATKGKQAKPSWAQKHLKNLKLAKLGALKVIRLIAIPLAFLISIYDVVTDALMGSMKAGEWDVSKFSATFGGAVAGDAKKGWGNVGAQALKYAGIGGLAGLAGGPFGVLAGSLIGGIFGSIMGIIGGEKIAIAMESMGNNINAKWIKWIEIPFQKLFGVIERKVLMPLDAALSPIADEIVIMAKPVTDLLDDVSGGFKKWLTGITKFLKKMLKFKVISDLLGGSDEDNAKKLEDSRKAKAEQEKEQKRILAENLKKKDALEIKDLKATIAKDKKAIANDDFRAGASGFFANRKTRLARNLARLTELGGSNVIGETYRDTLSQGAPPTVTPTGGGKMGPAGFGINFDPSQTRPSSWSGQTDMTKNKMATLASMFKGGLRVTSGFRTKETGNEAMKELGSDNFMKNYSKYMNMGSFEGGAGKASSEQRNKAIAHIRGMGFISKHEHGNAIDFSYPHPYSPETFSQLQSDIKSVFPGAKVRKEDDHLHMSFSDIAIPNQSGRALQQLQAQNNSLSGMGSGGGTTVVAPTNNNTKVINQSNYLQNPSGENRDDPALFLRK